MQESLKLILDIQEVDMKMMRLMRVKKERQKELEQLDSLRKELHNQGTDKEKEIAEITKTAAIYENKIQETNAKLKKLEAQQSSVKKVDEFNALTLEMTAAEKAAWLSNMTGVALGSDAFFPFRDNIDRAAQSGVKYIVQAGGSIRDDIVIAACNEYDIAMVCSGVRLFHH